MLQPVQDRATLGVNDAGVARYKRALLSSSMCPGYLRLPEHRTLCGFMKTTSCTIGRLWGVWTPNWNIDHHSSWDLKANTRPGHVYWP